MKNYILESVINDTYLQENGAFTESLESVAFTESLESVALFTLKEVQEKQRSLKLKGTATHIRNYQDKKVNFYNNSPENWEV